MYHVNEHKFGPIPLNMDTGDALGDMFFDMFEVIIQPLICQSGSNHAFGPNPCTNQEAAGKDLRVNIKANTGGGLSLLWICHVQCGAKWHRSVQSHMSDRHVLLLLQCQS